MVGIVALALAVSGLTAAGGASAGAATANNPVGYFDSAKPVPGKVQVRGWAVDPNSPKTGIVVRITVGNSVQTVTANVSRADVAKAHPAYGAKHGFSASISYPKTGSVKVCAIALNIGPGTNKSLGCKTVKLSNNPFGSLGSAQFVTGKVQVTGWAVDPNNPKRSIRVRITVGTSVHTVTANAVRTDVAKAYPAYGAKHGYSALIAYPKNGSVKVCATALNIGSGANASLGCKTVLVNNNPFGHLDSVQFVAGKVQVSGWAADPNRPTSGIGVRITVGTATSAVTANGSRTDVAKAYPAYGAKHGYTAAIAYPVNGSVKVCVTAVNVGAGANTSLGCKTVAVDNNPFGALETVTRASTSAATVTGWAIDPNTASPISVSVTAGGVAVGTLVAGVDRGDIAKSHPGWGAAHGFSATIPVSAADQMVCATAVNVGAGANVALPSCLELPVFGATAPLAPQTLGGTSTQTAIALTWKAPASDGGAKISGYRVVVNPGNKVTTVTATGTTVTGLVAGTAYTVSVSALNMIGASAPASYAISTAPKPVVPQVTPAPVSTSRYLRNLTGNTTTDAAITKVMGAADAAANPSGHQYLIVLEMGGQDQTRGGVLLTAGTKFVSNAAVVSALEAYIDGYASKQKANAPLLLAVGTNNDVDVTATAGKMWATAVINPLVAYAAKYPNIKVAGADDMEPGFSATVAESKNWLTGYLGATSAQFVFNGSADGCSTTATASKCNNGWTMADLQYLAGGAAPTRTIVLPQIYVTAQPLQWATISLTGTYAGKAKLNFGGPLTEWTACSQAGCYSMTNVTAYQQLWSAISANSATQQASMPYGTDLRIN
ncbi:MAG: fibronectin type III domain-containing protein [Actinomycetia bacterium]|nr:fibronectin type III domain-containing protein [Actinomycetes bacterium]